MKTILLDDFLDDGIIREKSFRKMVKDLNMKEYKDKKVIIKGCAGDCTNLGILNFGITSFTIRK